MRNLLYLNGDGMVNVHPEKNTAQINDEWYCEMNEDEFNKYLTKHDLYCVNGELRDNEDNYIYGTILEIK